MQKTLSQIFNETAAAAYKAFPRELKRLVVLLVPNTDTPVYVSPEVAQKLTNSTEAVRKAVNKLTAYMLEHNAAGGANKHWPLADTVVNLIALDSVNVLGPFSDRYTKEMRAILTLDHEIGHHILRNGFSYAPGGTPQKAESAADAFAMLRHIQRFGKNTGYAGNRCESIAHCIILFSDTEHYTSDALQRAIDVAEEMGEKLYTLSLQETAKLAADIADETFVDQTTLDKIRDAYLPVAAYCKAHIGNGLEIAKRLYNDDDTAKAIYCRETLAVMRRNGNRNDPDIFTAGKRFLTFPVLKDFMLKAAATEKDGYWKDALDFINHAVPNVTERPAQTKNVRTNRYNFSV